MITTADTNVLLDVLLQIEPYWKLSQRWLREAYEGGAILVCDMVYAELVPAFDDKDSLDEALAEIGASVSNRRR